MMTWKKSPHRPQVSRHHRRDVGATTITSNRIAHHDGKHHHHDHDPTLPCFSCNKRHARPHYRDDVVVTGGGSSSIAPSFKTKTLFVTLFLALLSAPAGAAHAYANAATTAAAAASAPVKHADDAHKVKLLDFDGGSFGSKKPRELAGEALDDLHSAPQLFDEHHHDGDEDEDEEEGTESFLTSPFLDGGMEEDHDDEDHEDHEDEEHHDDLHEDHEDHHDDHEDENVHSNHSANDTKTSQPWGQIIGATLLVNLASLTGLLLFVVPMMHRGFFKYCNKNGEQQPPDFGKSKLINICIPAFAVGALMATAAFLVFPEAMHMIEGAHSDHQDGGDAADSHDNHRFLQGDVHEDGHDDHGDMHQDDNHDGHGEEGNSESLAAARFGMALLGGFLLPAFFSLLFPNHCHRNHLLAEPVNHSANVLNNAEEKSFASGHDEEECASCIMGEVEVGVSVAPSSSSPAIREIDIGKKINPDEDDTFQDKCDCCEACDVEGTAPTGNNNIQINTSSSLAIAQSPEEPSNLTVQAKTKTFIDKRLILSIIVGDAMCNFADGLFVSAALLSCPGPTAISILIITLLHEIPQEFADFFLMTQYAGLSVVQASVVNFVSGLSVTLGGIVVLAGNPSDVSVGILLTMAGGAYLNIAACETIPRLERFVEGRLDRLMMLGSFISGAVPFGLILLKHEHCG